MTITETALRDRCCLRLVDYRVVPTGLCRLATFGAEDVKGRAERHELFVTLVDELSLDEDDAEVLAFGGDAP